MVELKEAAHLVLLALGERAANQGPFGTDAKVIGEATALPAKTVNDAVRYLKTRGLVESYTGIGTSSGHDFLHAKLTPEGLESYAEANKGSKPSQYSSLQGSNTPGPVVRGGRSKPVDQRAVMVIHGRNEKGRKAMFDFLRAINLDPIEWEQAVGLTGHGSPYIGEVLDATFNRAQGVVALFSGDDLAKLRDELVETGKPKEELAPQARPNVIFEAGMAMGREARRTILVELGHVRPFSDIGGRHVVRIGNDMKSRQALAERLRTAGCDVNTSGTDWHEAGDFDGAVLRVTEPNSTSTMPDGLAAKEKARQSDVKLTIGYRVKSKSAEIHHYQLFALVRNMGNRRIDDWEIEVDFPTPLLEPNTGWSTRIAGKSDHTLSLFRSGKEHLGQPLRAGEEREAITIDYHVDREIYDRRNELFGQVVKARLSVNAEIIATEERRVGDLQDF